MADATAYVTSAEIKAAAPDVFSGTTHDALLTTLAGRATSILDGLCGWGTLGFDVVTTATDRYYNGKGGETCRIDPCIAITTVSVKASESSADFTAWTASDFESAAGAAASPDYNAGYYTLLIVKPGVSKTFTTGRNTVKVTGRFGRMDTPTETVKQATIHLALALFKRGQAAYGPSVGISELGVIQLNDKTLREVQDLMAQAGLKRGRL